MGIGPGLTALKAAYRATGKSFEGFCFVHLRLLLSTAAGMRNSYAGADFDSMRLRLTTYLKYRNNIPRLRKKEYDWFCTKLQNNTIRLQLGSAKYAPKFTLYRHRPAHNLSEIRYTRCMGHLFQRRFGQHQRYFQLFAGECSVTPSLPCTSTTSIQKATVASDLDGPEYVVLSDSTDCAEGSRLLRSRCVPPS